MPNSTIRLTTAAMQPGGLIGFSGADLVGDLVNLATWGIPRWGLSHIAIVAPHVAWRKPILVESTTLCDQPCIYTGEANAGVQAHRIPDRVDAYRGRVWYYPIAKPLSASDARSLACWCYTQRGTRYDLFGAIHARDCCCGWLGRLLFPDDPAALYCSEFVPMALRYLDLFDSDDSGWSPNRLARYCVRYGIHGRPIQIK